MTNTSSNRVVWADALKVFACFFVACIHSSALALRAFTATPPTGNANWWMLVTLNCISRFAVPVFLMVTGVFLLAPERKFSGKKLFSYIRRITVVLIATSLIWAIIEVCLNLPSEEKTFRSFLRITLQTPYHMWYLWALLGIYVITPVLRQIAKDRWALMTSLFVGGTVIFLQGLASQLGNEGAQLLNHNMLWLLELVESKLSLSLAVTFPVIYVLLGYWLASTDFHYRSRRLLYGCCILSIFVAGWLIWRTDSYSGLHTADVGNTNIFVAVYSAAVFVYFKGKRKISSPTMAVTRLVSPYLLWIYAIHAVVLELLHLVTPLDDFYRYTGVVGAIGVGILVFVVSVLLARAIELSKSVLRNRLNKAK